MDLGLTGRSYVITGGSSGLGLATARCLSDEHARVLLAARSEQRLSRAAEEIGARALAIDLSTENAADRLASESVRAFGTVDGVLVNVGGPAPGTALEYSEPQWRAAIDGVLLASVRVARSFAPILVDGGAMLFVLSTTVREPITGLGASNVLRPGLAMLVKELSRELAPRIRVNGILPGRIATERMTALTGGDAAALAAVEKSIPLGRLGSPEEFGAVATFLLSPAASYVTGSLIPVDGGILHSPW